jgi:predicted aldo/keto reductase-like oxidoreductase
MLYSKLGNTGITVSKLGFGTMRLPVEINNPDLKKAINLIDYAIQKRINFFDVGTFYCYNRCEKIFSEILNSHLNENIVLSGKNTTHQHNATNWTEQLRNTLRTYNCRSLDVYFIHYLDHEVWIKHFIKGGIIEQIQETRQKGLFKYLGFSSHDTPDNVSKLIDTRYFNAVILSYNLLNREYEEVIKYANEKGLGVIIMNPLAGGLLTRQQIRVDSLLQYIPMNTLHDIALNYVYSNPFVNCVLSGMQNEIEIENNVDSLLSRPRFTIDQINQINKLIDDEKSKQFYYCTNCNYCMPCTQGIDIPSIISIMNKYSIKTDNPFFMRDYSVLQQPASCCIACGNCEIKCPNKLPVSAIMAKAASKFIE